MSKGPRSIALVLLAGMALAGCTLPGLEGLEGVSPSPSPIPADITPADAIKAAQSAWDERESGYVHIDANPIDRAESGELANIDRNILTLRDRAHQGGEPAARTLNNLRVFVPHQRVYPAFFLAMAETADIGSDLKPLGQQLTHLMILTKADPPSAFKLSFLAVQDPAQSLPELKKDGDGYAVMVENIGQAAVLKVSADKLGSAYADTLTAVKAGQDPPNNGIAAGRFTTQEGASERDFAAVEAPKGVSFKADWAGLPNVSNYAFETTDGNSLGLFEARASFLFVNTRGNGGGFCIITLPTPAQILRGIPPAILRTLSGTSIAMGAAVVPKIADKDKLITVPAMADGPSALDASPCE